MAEIATKETIATTPTSRVKIVANLSPKVEKLILF